MTLSVSILRTQFMLLKEELRCKSKSRICKEVKNIVMLVVWYSAKPIISGYPEPLKCGLSLLMSISRENGTLLSPVIVSFEEVTGKCWRPLHLWHLFWLSTNALKCPWLLILIEQRWQVTNWGKHLEKKKNDWKRSASGGREGLRNDLLSIGHDENPVSKQHHHINKMQKYLVHPSRRVKMCLVVYFNPLLRTLHCFLHIHLSSICMRRWAPTCYLPANDMLIY